jgi:plasmid stabilization system protein ParE
MKVVYSSAAQADLDDILHYTTRHYPRNLPAVEARIRAVIARIALHPQSARRVDERPGVRVVPVLRYPFRIFYRVDRERVEILHIHHTARDRW